MAVDYVLSRRVSGRPLTARPSPRPTLSVQREPFLPPDYRSLANTHLSRLPTSTPRKRAPTQPRPESGPSVDHSGDAVFYDLAGPLQPRPQSGRELSSMRAEHQPRRPTHKAKNGRPSSSPGWVALVRARNEWLESMNTWNAGRAGP